MSARAITRRSLLVAGAGAFAASVLRPPGALAALAGPATPRVAERWVGDVAAGSVATVHLGRPVDLLGLQWSGPSGAPVQLRVAAPGGGWSRWVAAGAHGHAPDGAGAGAQLGEPIWTGGASRMQLRSAHALSGVRVHTVDVSAGVGARRAALASRWLAHDAALALAGPPLSSAVAQPAIVARRAWARGIARPRVAPEYGGVRMAFVHHTENPNGYLAAEVPAMLRAIYAFHRFVRGWNDIGYNFVIDAYGRIFEARAGGVQEPVVGAHAGGYNRYSTGVAVLGSFMSAPVSVPARSALQALLAWKLSLHGVRARGRVQVRVNPAGAAFSRFPAGARVWLPRIAGHRDADSTDCPGNALYGELRGVRGGVLALAPRPAVVTIALASGETAPAPAPGASGPGTPAPAPAPVLGGRVAFADGVPVAGAQVLIQARTVGARGESVLEQTLAEALTDPTGAWSAPLPAAIAPGGAWLRALYPGAGGSGAAVSEPIRVSPAVAEAPLPASPAPAPAAATPGLSPTS